MSEIRDLELANKVFNPDTGDTNKRDFIMKTIQTWVNDIDYDWNGNNHTLGTSINHVDCFWTLLTPLPGHL